MEHRSYAYGKNHWLLDADLRPILSKHWPQWGEHEQTLIDFGNVAGGRAYEVAEHIDRGAAPVLVMHDVDGNRIDRVRLSPAHAALLKDIAFINRAPYEGGSWHQHFALGYLLADPGLYCSLIVTNQTAYAIYKYLPDQQHWLQPLLSGDAWGATWMTETHGGSDLGANKTLARLAADGWKLYGDDKYFASNAGLADVAIVTARPEGAPPGPKGIALFLVPRIAPRLNADGQLNYHVRRLKDKSATRAVPSGEVEFDGAQAFLVGQKELGIYYTMENLTVSRLANAAGAMGLARKAQLESLYRTQARSAFGKPIVDHPLVRYDLTDLAVRIAGGLALLFHAVAWFDRVWRETPPYSERYHYARFLSHLLKNRTAEHGAAATQLAMELFGGIGFLDDFPIARLHRESLVTIIWEGTSNIQALDMLEAIRKKSAHESFLDELLPMLDRANTPEAKQTRRTIEDTLKHLLTLEPAEAQWHSKDVLRTLADGAQVALLYDLAQSASERAGGRYAKLAALYAHRFLQHESFPAWALTDREVWCPLD